MNEMEQLKQRVAVLEAFIARMSLSDRYAFQKHIQIFDGMNIQLGRGTGTKIGLSASEKLGFFGHAPVAQQAAITAPSGGATIDAPARTAINDIRTTLQSLGFTA